MNRPLPPQDDGCSGEGGSCSSSSGPPGTTLAGPTPSNGAPGASVKPAEGSAGENKNQIYAELETGLDPEDCGTKLRELGSYEVLARLVDSDDKVLAH